MISKCTRCICKSDPTVHGTCYFVSSTRIMSRNRERWAVCEPSLSYGTISFQWPTGSVAQLGKWMKSSKMLSSGVMKTFTYAIVIKSGLNIKPHAIYWPISVSHVSKYAKCESRINQCCMRVISHCSYFSIRMQANMRKSYILKNRATASLDKIPSGTQQSSHLGGEQATFIIYQLVIQHTLTFCMRHEWCSKSKYKQSPAIRGG